MNGFILVFGMVLVLAVERRFAADRAAVGGPARSRQSRPVAGCPPAAVRPCSRCPPRGRVPTRSRRPRPWAGARALADGKMLAKCVPPASDSGEISPRCVPGRRSVAAFSLHAFPRGPRMGKAPLPGNISPPCIRNGLALARYLRRASEKPCERAFGDAPREDLARKGPLSLRGPLRSCMACGSCRRSALAGCWASCVKGLGPGCVSAFRIAADGPACRHGISLRSAAAAYPAANASPRGTLRPQSRSPAAIAPPCGTLRPPRPLSVGSGFP